MPGSGSGSASAAATGGKSAPRRRGARRDCDRVSKAEDVPEYKGSLPVEELLAFVEGSVSSSSPGGIRMPVADGKLRQGRTKRKEPLPAVDADPPKLRNGDSRLVEMAVPLPPHLAFLPHAEPLNGLLNGPSKHSEPPVSLLPMNFDSSVDSQFPENKWLSSELASKSMVNDSYDSGAVERKEKDFVLVQKKRRSKIVTAIDGSVKSVKPLNGICVTKNGVGNTVLAGSEEYAYVNGFSVEEILEANHSAVSQNSSEDSLARSFGSDIGDLSHFVGEDGHGSGDLFVDAPLNWDDVVDDNDADKEESLSSFCSTMSSTESRQRLNSPCLYKVELSDINQTDILIEGRSGSVSDHLPDDSVTTADEQSHSVNNRVIHATQRLQMESGNIATLHTDDLRRRCTDTCCTVPYDHANQRTPVIFCDSAPARIIEDVSGFMFSFGCTMSDHLLDGGLCIESRCAGFSPDTECELSSIERWCPEPPAVDASHCDGIVSFMYSDSIRERRSSSTDRLEPKNCMQTCNGDVHSNGDSVGHFQVHDVRLYMYRSKCC